MLVAELAAVEAFAVVSASAPGYASAPERPFAVAREPLSAVVLEASFVAVAAELAEEA